MPARHRRQPSAFAVSTISLPAFGLPAAAGCCARLPAVPRSMSRLRRDRLCRTRRPDSSDAAVLPVARRRLGQRGFRRNGCRRSDGSGQCHIGCRAGCIGCRCLLDSTDAATAALAAACASVLARGGSAAASVAAARCRCDVGIDLGLRRCGRCIGDGERWRRWRRPRSPAAPWRLAGCRRRSGNVGRHDGDGNRNGDRVRRRRGRVVLRRRGGRIDCGMAGEACRRKLALRSISRSPAFEAPDFARERWDGIGVGVGIGVGSAVWRRRRGRLNCFCAARSAAAASRDRRLSVACRRVVGAALRADCCCARGSAGAIVAGVGGRAAVDQRARNCRFPATGRICADFGGGAPERTRWLLASDVTLNTGAPLAMKLDLRSARTGPPRVSKKYQYISIAYVRAG